MNKSPQYNQQKLRKYVYTNIWKVAVTTSLKIKIVGSMPVKSPKQQYLKVVTFNDPSFSKKRIYVYDHAVQITHWADHPVNEKVLNIRHKLGLFVLRGHWQMESSHSLHQIDASGWLGLALWYLRFDTWNNLFNSYLIEKILFNFKKKILAWIKANLKWKLLTLNS